MLKLVNISKLFIKSDGGRIKVTSGLSLELKGGDLALVVGAPKSGKSTIMLIAAGLLKPDTGAVDFITQPDIYSLPPYELNLLRNREVGCIFHKYHLIQRLSVLDNIMTPDLVEAHPTSPERAETLLRRLKIVQHRECLPRELSPLDKQKTTLGRAILHLPRILLADEPTENLGTEDTAAILEDFQDYADEGNCVVIFTRDETLPVSSEKTLKL